MFATSSAAQDLATGSQDLAALAGFFCTDGVERNALATQSGYGTVVVSSLFLFWHARFGEKYDLTRSRTGGLL